MDRQEPTLEKSEDRTGTVTTLSERVRLTWRDVRDLAAHAVPDPVPADAQSAPPSATPPAVAVEALHETAPLLDEAVVEHMARALAPAVEASVRAALRETLDMALTNALTRAKSDVDRSIGGIVSRAVAEELRRLDPDALRR